MLVFAQFSRLSPDFVSSVRLNTSAGRRKEKGPERRPPRLPLAAPSHSYFSRASPFVGVLLLPVSSGPQWRRFLLVFFGLVFARPAVASVLLDPQWRRFCSTRSGVGFCSLRFRVCSILLDSLVLVFARTCSILLDSLVLVFARTCSILLDSLVLVFARFARLSSDFVSSVRLHTSSGRRKEKGPERRPPRLPLAAPSHSYVSRASPFVGVLLLPVSSGPQWRRFFFFFACILRSRICSARCGVGFARPAVASVFARPAVASVLLDPQWRQFRSTRSGVGFCSLRFRVCSILLDSLVLVFARTCSILLDSLVLVFARFARLSACCALPQLLLTRESVRRCPSSASFVRPAVVSVLFHPQWRRCCFCSSFLYLLVMLLLALLRFLVAELGGGGGVLCSFHGMPKRKVLLPVEG